jgi:hypothetical protein
MGRISNYTGIAGNHLKEGETASFVEMILEIVDEL